MASQKCHLMQNNDYKDQSELNEGKNILITVCRL